MNLKKKQKPIIINYLIQDVLKHADWFVWNEVYFHMLAPPNKVNYQCHKRQKISNL